MIYTASMMGNITCSYTKYHYKLLLLLIWLECYHDTGIMDIEKKIMFPIICANSSKAIIQTLKVNDPTF